MWDTREINMYFVLLGARTRVCVALFGVSCVEISLWPGVGRRLRRLGDCSYIIRVCVCVSDIIRERFPPGQVHASCLSKTTAHTHAHTPGTCTKPSSSAESNINNNPRARSAFGVLRVCAECLCGIIVRSRSNHGASISANFSDKRPTTHRFKLRTSEGMRPMMAGTVCFLGARLGDRFSIFGAPVGRVRDD